MAVKKHAIAVCGDTDLINQDPKLVKAHEDEAEGLRVGNRIENRNETTQSEQQGFRF